MAIGKTLEVLNAMEAEGIIGRYAIAGAVAAYNYIEPSLSEALEVLIVGDTEKIAQAGSLIGDEHLRLLPVASDLDEEALTEAFEVNLERAGEPVVKTRVLKPEHVIAIALCTARSQDRTRVAQFLEEGAVPTASLSSVLSRHGLGHLWSSFHHSFVVEKPLTDTEDTTRKTSYLDISDILEQKAEARRVRAKRSFAEKIAAMEALRERLKPFKKAREKRQAERKP